MIKRRSLFEGDPTPVVGGKEPPAEMFDPSITEDMIPEDDTDRLLFWLARSYYKEPKYTKQEIMQFDQATKQALIDQLRKNLGIQPFKKDII